MRRMYSEQELTKIIKIVFEEELESGALDDLVSDAVDAYLVEHPVDITALEGQDVELNSLDATGLITGGEIVEKMSGYSAVIASISNLTINPVYIGVVKNGNKITFCCALELTRTDEVAGDNSVLVGFNIPSVVGSKLYPTSVGGYSSLTCGLAQATLDTRTFNSIPFRVVKPNNAAIQLACSNNSHINALTANSKYYVRFEFTFLLSENIAPEE